MKRRTYGYDRVKLSDAYTIEELTEMAREIREDPKNWAEPGGVWIYTRGARTKLDNISWAIRYRAKEGQAA